MLHRGNCRSAAKAASKPSPAGSNLSSLHWARTAVSDMSRDGGSERLTTRRSKRKETRNSLQRLLRMKMQSSCAPGIGLRCRRDCRRHEHYRPKTKLPLAVPKTLTLCGFKDWFSAVVMIPQPRTAALRLSSPALYPLRYRWQRPTDSMD